MTELEAAREIIREIHALTDGAEIYIYEVRPPGQPLKGYDYTVKHLIAGFIPIHDVNQRLQK